MPTLKLAQKNIAVAHNVIKATRLVDRMVGLLGHKTLSDDHVLWIASCNSIHTFFMRFAIDAVFVNHEGRVVSVFENIRPWRVIWPQWGARSVYEFAAGAVRKTGIKVGDQLYVGT